LPITCALADSKLDGRQVLTAILDHDPTLTTQWPGTECNGKKEHSIMTEQWPHRRRADHRRSPGDHVTGGTVRRRRFKGFFAALATLLVLGLIGPGTAEAVAQETPAPPVRFHVVLTQAGVRSGPGDPHLHAGADIWVYPTQQLIKVNGYNTPGQNIRMYAYGENYGQLRRMFRLDAGDYTFFFAGGVCPNGRSGCELVGSYAALMLQHPERFRFVSYTAQYPPVSYPADGRGGAIAGTVGRGPRPTVPGVPG
jgi:hypothetical protein